MLKIIKSRLKKLKEEDFVKERKKICNDCPHNTKNINRLSIKQKSLDLLSNLLTFIMTGKFNEDKSACNLCGCTLIYKIPEIDEVCDDGRWRSIYLPNSAQKIKKQRK